MSLTDGPLKSDSLTTPADGQAAAAEAFRRSLTPDPTTNKVVFQVRVLTPVINMSHTFIEYKGNLPITPGQIARAAKKNNPATAILELAGIDRSTPARDIDPSVEDSQGISSKVAAWYEKNRDKSKDEAPTAAGPLSLPEPVGANKYYFWGRIITEPDAPFPSPHSMFADPCTLHSTVKPTRALELIQLHTKFISKSGYAGATPVVGDIVEVTLDKGDISYNIQYCHFDEISDITQKEATNMFGEQQCTNLSNSFNDWDGTTTGFTDSIAIPGGEVGPEWATNDDDRNILIDNFSAALINFGMPKGFRVSSRGRTVGYGQNMVMRMADSCKIPRTPGPAPRSDNASWDPAEITRLCAKIKKSCGKVVADPPKSPHCKPGGIYRGTGCTGASLNRIAFDVAGADLWKISRALEKFKKAPASNPKGYQALLKDGTLLSTFVSFGWTGGPKCPPKGFGWCVEPNNGCVHIEIVPAEKPETESIPGGADSGQAEDGTEDTTVNNE
tara:strand:+ start:9966 stop:11468 length:1503 start_codon:yes stop_codon:yes gene_type:complete